MPRYIRDLIELPEQVHRGDFVLRLTEGVEHPAETLGHYVVTPQLVECFDDALGFIEVRLEAAHAARRPTCTAASAAARATSWPCCTCSCSTIRSARAIPELASVVATHNAWTPGTQVPARAVSHDRRTLDGVGHPRHYVEHVRAAPPGGAAAGRLPGRATSSSTRGSCESRSATRRSSPSSTRGGGGARLGQRWRPAWDAASLRGRGCRAARRPRTRARLVGDLIRPVLRPTAGRRRARTRRSSRSTMGLCDHQPARQGLWATTPSSCSSTS